MISRAPYSPDAPPELREMCQSERLLPVGVCDAVHDPDAEARYRDWLREGNAGSMEYLERHASMKYRPSLLLDGCKSIVAVAINYWQPSSGAAAPSQGRIARYAWGRDYHKVLGKRLKRVVARMRERWPDHQFRSFTDATPLDERHYAELAGVGFTGRNTLLINSHYGSWFLVGEVLSTKRFAPSGGAKLHGACPSGCRRCLNVCPTGALTAPYKIDASRCIAYLTIEHKGAIPEELRPKMGNWLFGCDLCQEVCPLNAQATVTEEPDFKRRYAGETRELDDILRLRDHADMTRRFAGSPLMRAGRRGLVRNAAVVAGNSGRREFIPLLQKLARDDDAIVAEHARWAKRRLEQPASAR